MGFQHHTQELPDDSGVASALPTLADRQVAEAVHLAEAHEAARKALLGLSGVALLQSVSTYHPSDLAGVLAVIDDHLSRARDAGVRARSSASEALASRAQVILTVADVLAAQTRRVTAPPFETLELSFLESALALLSRAALPQIGMRRFSSVSCAAYPSAAAAALHAVGTHSHAKHFHGEPHDDGHGSVDHGHDHAHHHHAHHGHSR